MGVIFPTKICTRIASGKVNKTRFRFGMLIPNLRNNLDKRGARSHIPINDTARSNMAYPAMRNDLRYSIVLIYYRY